MDLSGRFGNMHSVAFSIDRAHVVCLRTGYTIGIDSVQTDLDDMVLPHIDTCGLKVKEYNRSFKL